jgi:acetylornithine deacetylase/succinyl-diaminopimelate desuccinylase-like protein
MEGARLNVSEVIATNRDMYVGWLMEACSIPSLATNPEGLKEMSSWVESKLDELGAEVERLSYSGAPDALLGTMGAGSSILIYDHYDVQPVDPINLWISEPFRPEVRDGVLYARGTADNKGDLVARLAALHAYREAGVELPCRIKFLIEGEEETGSKSFEAMVSRYRDKLGAEGCIWEGAGIDHAGRAEVVFGAKGLAYVELSYRGLAEDQHSSLAVIAPSPVWHLIEALVTLRAPDGRVLIEGFYNDVEEPGKQDLEVLASFPFEEEAERQRLGVDGFVGGDTGAALITRYFFQPTCNIAGIVAGFIEPGTSKTVLPKEASCKIDMRLVPRQDPDDIVAKLRKHLDNQGFGDIEITRYSMEHPVRSPMDAQIGGASLRAAQKLFSAVAVAPLMIGTGPMYPIASALRIPTVSPAGVCRPDSNIHAPNENCRIDDFIRIIEYTAMWIDEFGNGH